VRSISPNLTAAARRVWVLKGGATLLTLATTAASALYVTSHLKNPSAPLQPTVLTSAQLNAVTVTPGVQQSDVTPVTSTYAS
jgi:hypothetical protein